MPVYDEDFIIEFISHGNVLKVTAVCTRTGKEVSIVGDPRANRRELQQLAVRKLKYVMARDAEKTGHQKGLII